MIKKISIPVIVVLLLNTGCQQPSYQVNQPSPITVENSDRPGRPANKQMFVTYRNRLHEGNWIGHRLYEHEPLVYGEVPSTPEQAGIDPVATEQLEKQFADKPGVFKTVYLVDAEGWVRSDWTYYFAPAPDGIDILLVVQTLDEGIPSYYGIQECLRMGGTTNGKWRQAVATTPAFSEYDLWQLHEKDKAGKTSLSYIEWDGRWQAFPACKETVGARTAYGKCIDQQMHGGELPDKIGPYEAKMLATMDNPLVARKSVDGCWVCGMGWEGTSHVSVHHPADCLHSIVNIGPIPPHGKRAIRGKVYWFKGSLIELTKKWNTDFPDKANK